MAKSPTPIRIKKWGKVKGGDKDYQPQMYLGKLSCLREVELRYANLWSRAQRIHGTMHTAIICTGDVCACSRLAQEAIDKFTKIHFLRAENTN